MAEQIRFYLDEHISRRVALGLRRRGIDVLRAQEAGLREAEDEDHFATALRERRVIVTQDADFLAKHDRGEHHFGIAYSKQGSRSIGEMIAALDLIYQVMEPQEMVDHVEYM